MKFIRKFLRILKYRIKFLAKNNNAKINYFVQSSFLDKNLTDLMNAYGSDKGGFNKDHNFSDYYSTIFFDKKESFKNILEVGLGTNNINVPSNMGLEGKPLASLRAWRDYFLNANIYGADIDRKILKDEDRIKTYYVDQTNPSSILELFKNIGDISFDIIIDDGLHEYNANICLFENSFKFLKKKGIYVIEDVFFKDKNKFFQYFKNSNYNFSIVDIFHKNNISNNCLVIIYKF
jgi:SAM-dependent methyltransferase